MPKINENKFSLPNLEMLVGRSVFFFFSHLFIATAACKSAHVVGVSVAMRGLCCRARSTVAADVGADACHLLHY